MFNDCTRTSIKIFTSNEIQRHSVVSVEISRQNLPLQPSLSPDSPVSSCQNEKLDPIRPKIQLHAPFSNASCPKQKPCVPSTTHQCGHTSASALICFHTSPQAVGPAFKQTAHDGIIVVAVASRPLSPSPSLNTTLPLSVPYASSYRFYLQSRAVDVYAPELLISLSRR